MKVRYGLWDTVCVVTIVFQDSYYLAVIWLTFVMTAKAVHRTVHYVFLEKGCCFTFVTLFTSHDNGTTSCLGKPKSHIFCKFMFALVRWFVLNQLLQWCSVTFQSMVCTLLLFDWIPPSWNIWYQCWIDRTITIAYKINVSNTMLFLAARNPSKIRSDSIDEDAPVQFLKQVCVFVGLSFLQTEQYLFHTPV